LVTNVSAGTLRAICCTSGNLFIVVDDQGVAYTDFDNTAWTAEDPGLGAVFLSSVASG